MNLWFQKKQKIFMRYYCFFGIHESSISTWIFYPKNHRTHFPIATPAARVTHSTWGSLPAANAEILTVIFWCKNRRAVVDLSSRRRRDHTSSWIILLNLIYFCFNEYGFFIWRQSLLFSLMKKVTKKSSLQIKSLKTTLKFHFAPRAVRPADSTRGVLPLHFFVVFRCFLFKGGRRFVISTQQIFH